MARLLPSRLSLACVLLSCSDAARTGRQQRLRQRLRDRTGGADRRLHAHDRRPDGASRQTGPPPITSVAMRGRSARITIAPSPTTARSNRSVGFGRLQASSRLGVLYTSRSSESALPLPRVDPNQSQGFYPIAGPPGSRRATPSAASPTSTGRSVSIRNMA